MAGEVGTVRDTRGEGLKDVTSIEILETVASHDGGVSQVGVWRRRGSWSERNVRDGGPR